MRKLLIILLIIISIFFVLNINVSTRRGVNYQVQTLKIPLYLKLLDFFDRHYNYVQLARNITFGARTEEEKAFKIFEWTFKNIRRAPAGLPIIDDHVWNIIIRGYAVDDQFQDVFTTLCNYAKINAFFSYVYSTDRIQKIPLSFVYINKGWRVFDVYAGVYFEDKKGDLADIETIKLNKWTIGNLSDAPQKYRDYKIYVDSLSAIKDMGLARAKIQSPLNRLIFEIKKYTKCH